MRLSESMSIPPGERASTHLCTHTQPMYLPAVSVYRPQRNRILSFSFRIRPVGGSPRCYLHLLRLFKLSALCAGDGAIITGASAVTAERGLRCFIVATRFQIGFISENGIRVRKEILLGVCSIKKIYLFDFDT